MPTKPQETKLVNLESICHLITDGKHGDCENEDGSGYYFLSAKDVKNGKLNYEGARQITKDDFSQTHKRTQLEPLDILMSNSGTIGRMAIAQDSELTGRTTFQKSVAIIKPNKKLVYPYWLLYYFYSVQNKLINTAGGTAQVNLLLRDLRSFPINLPPMPVQRRIADILSAYDNLIENNLRRIRILEQMAQTIYQEWFVNFRYPEHKSIDLIDTKLGSAPKNWEVVSLESVCSKITDGSHYSPPSISDNGYPMASVKDMTDWDINVDSCRRISEDEYLKLIKNDCKPQQGDVLVAKDGSYLKHIFVVQKERELVLLSSIAILRPNKKIYPYILSMYLRGKSQNSRFCLLGGFPSMFQNTT